MDIYLLPVPEKNLEAYRQRSRGRLGAPRSTDAQEPMSVSVTLGVSGDPAAFEEQVAAQAEAIGRIVDVAKRHGLIAHRWYGADGEFMAVDESAEPRPARRAWR